MKKIELSKGYKNNIKKIIENKKNPDFQFIVDSFLSIGLSVIYHDINESKILLEEVMAINTFDAIERKLNISFRVDERPDIAGKFIITVFDYFKLFNITINIDEPFYSYNDIYKKGNDAVKLYTAEIDDLSEERARIIYREYKILDNLTEDNAKYKAWESYILINA